MPCYEISEVDGVENADIINRFNAMCPETFPALEPRHFDGYWWLAHLEGEPVAFAGMVAFEPFASVGYLKRCLVLPDHHGRGLQFRLMKARELKAKSLGWTQLVSECAADSFSASNFRKAGFSITDPEQKWGAAGSVYWVKMIG